MSEAGKVFLAILGIAICIVVIFIAAKPLASEQTARAQERTLQVQAQAQAQTAVQQERTERERLANELQQQTAGLRAEQDARTTNGLLLILAVGAVVAVGCLVLGFVLFGVSWFEGKQTQRTLLLIEAQRNVQLLSMYQGQGEVPTMLLPSQSVRRVN